MAHLHTVVAPVSDEQTAVGERDPMWEHELVWADAAAADGGDEAERRVKHDDTVGVAVAHVE